MTRSDDLYTLPPGLPAPLDDGSCRHLAGHPVPAVPLPATDGSTVDLAFVRGRSVVYCYPRTGRPDAEAPPGWDEVPGARGCTPQACAFRDHADEIARLGARLFGLSTQPTAYQQEAVARLRLPFPLLSDEDFELIDAIGLPTFELGGFRFVQRVTLIVRDGVVEHAFYPVFPPDQNAAEVAAWLAQAPPLRR